MFAFKKIIGVGLLLICCHCSVGQSICDTIQHFLSSKEYGKARALVTKTLNRHPSQNECFFQKALTAYDSSILKNPILKDSIFSVITIWHTVYGSCNVLNEEARRYYLYKYNQQNYEETVCPYLTFSAYNCSKMDFYPESVLALGKCIKIGSSSYNPSNERYSCGNEEFIWQYIHQNEIGLLQKKEWQELKRKTGLALLTCPVISCEKLDSLFIEELTASSDVAYAKRIASLLSQKNCIKTATYLKAGELILAHEPSFNGLLHQAKAYKQVGKWQEAYAYFAKAEKLARTPRQRSNCFMGIASVLQLQKDYAKAKDFAVLATETDPENRESFVFLGQLYEKAFELCDFGSIEEKCALNLLIAKTYTKANALQEAEIFYQKSDVMSLMKHGKVAHNQKLRLDCFLNEEVELKR